MSQMLVVIINASEASNSVLEFLQNIDQWGGGIFTCLKNWVFLTVKF